MNKIINKNSILVTYFEDNEYFLTANDLYGFYNTDVININNYQIEKPNNIFFSKVGLNAKLKIEAINNDIKIKCYAIKGNQEYEIKSHNEEYCDYIIIDNRFYYINFDILTINEILKKYSIKIDVPINYEEYIYLSKELRENSIKYEDYIIDKLDVLTKNDANKFLNNLKTSLFKYQEEGLNWLKFMVNNNCGCVLADEMGLGKTLQIIALMGYLYEKNNESHFLIIVPVSLLENWRREIEKFYPKLATYVHQGSNRTGFYGELLKYKVVLISYSNVISDLSMLNMINWDLVILDEAQNIKNPYALRTTAVKRINRKIGIAVTGTPFENHVTDIWSIFDFIMPSYLGSLNSFENLFEDDINSGYNIDSLIRPLMIRRKTEEVAKDLPKRVEISQPILMTEEEAKLYESKREECNLDNITLDMIQPLRLICTHPLVYNSSNSNKDPIQNSNKYARLCEILSEIFIKNEKVLIFTSFNKMIEIFIQDLKLRFDVPVSYINGSINPINRQEIIDNFSSIEGSAVLVLNPRAAGIGLNITAANNVIHYNLEWNPAIEDQASARSYRRGQDKTVFVYRLFYANTIEEVINERIRLKKDISSVAIVGNNGTDEDKKDFIRALNITPYWKEE